MVCVFITQCFSFLDRLYGNDITTFYDSEKLLIIWIGGWYTYMYFARNKICYFEYLVFCFTAAF